MHNNDVVQQMEKATQNIYTYIYIYIYIYIYTYICGTKIVEDKYVNVVFRNLAFVCSPEYLINILLLLLLLLLGQT